MRFSFAILALALGAAGACVGDRDTWSQQDPSASVQAVVHLSPPPSPCDTCIALSRRVVLGDTVGDGYIVATDFAVRALNGEYWLGQFDDMIKVFDGDGRYLRTVGRRGEGPGEFQVPLPVDADTLGVYVVDPVNRRLTLVGPDYDIAWIRPFPINPWGVARLDSNAWVVNAAVRSPEGLGHPLHIIRDSGGVASFGAPTQGQFDPLDVSREITTDSKGQIYSAVRTSSEVQVWNAAGSRVSTIRWPEFEEKEEQTASEGGASITLPTATISFLHVDSSDRLWVLWLLLEEDWKEHLTPKRHPGGAVSLEPDAVSNLYDTRIMVVDLAKHEIIALTVREEFFNGFLDDSTIMEALEAENGHPRLAAWRARVIP